MSKKVILTVKAAPQEDVGRNRARMGPKTRLELGVEIGDAVRIKGEKETVAEVYRLYPDEEGKGIIRIDGLVRKNAKVSVNDRVEVFKADLKPGKKVVIAPLIEEGNFLRFGESIDHYIKKQLINRPLMSNDAIVIPGISLMGGNVPFKIISTTPAEPIKVTEQTELMVKSEPVKENEILGTINVTYEDVGGLDDSLQRVREMIELPLKHPDLFKRLGIEPPKGVLLYGPPGTGKTWIAKAVASESGASFYSVQGPEIMSKYYGQSEGKLREKFEEAKENSPSIIFIDELDSIAPKRDDVKGEVEHRVVAQLLTLMDGLTQRGETIVIAATNRIDAIDPALRRPGRFDREIEIGLPDRDGRKDILLIHTRGMPLSRDVNLTEFAHMTHGFAGADLESLAKEAAMRALRRYIPEFDLDEPIPRDVLEKMEVRQEDFLHALREIEPSSLREIMVEIPEVSWDDVGGLKDIKERLMDSVQKPISDHEIFERMGISPPKGILLYGPPGTGKTLLAKAIANECDANFISVKGPELLSKWVGESEKAVREVFKKAKQAAPAIVFLDELDALAPERGYGEFASPTDRVVNQMLTSLDGIEPNTGIIVLAATNRPDQVDAALIRAGRFDQRIAIPIPDSEERMEIFAVHTKNMPMADDVDMDKLVMETDSYVGADIAALCMEAGLACIKENEEKVSMKHFEHALDILSPSIDEDIIRMYQEMEEFMDKTFRKKKDYNGVGIYR